jgi:ribonuclease HI
MSRPPKRPKSNVPPAPVADITLIFDGGSLGNPGKGYGSYVTTGMIESPDLVRVEFEGRKSNNEAEYLTLIHGLCRILQDLERGASDPGTVSLAVLSDSKLVVEQLSGRWKVRHPAMQPLHARATELLKHFRSSILVWHPRLESVRILGH